MIAKRIPSEKATSNVSRLVRYVVAAQGRDDPRTWTRTADYILDAGGNGEKVGGVRITNCISDDPAMATLEIVHMQAQNTRSNADKSYHLVFSFPEGERPSTATLHAIEDALCNAIGLGDHQRISAVHIDTAHLHVHVAINKVHPSTYRNVEPYYDKQRLMETCERLELAHGLIRTNHGLDRSTVRAITQPQENNYVESESIRRSLFTRSIRVLRQSYAAATAPRKVARTLDGLPTLSGVDVVRFTRGGEVLLPGHAPNHVEQGRAHDADALRRQADGRSGSGGESERVGTKRAPAGPAGDMEAYAGVESMLGWLKRDVASHLAAADSWESMHAKLGEYGLAIRPRGAGLVIGDGSIHVRASQVDRSLSMKALTARFGAYVEPQFGQVPSTAYVPRPRQPHVDSSTLYRDFQRERETRQQGRNVAADALSVDRQRRVRELKALHAVKRSVLKGIRGARIAKKIAYAALSMEMKQDFARLQADHGKKKQQQRAGDTGALTWQAWLAQQAQAGNEQALAVLRSREDQQTRIELDVLKAPNAAAARNIIFRNLKPVARRDGSLRYQTADGGVVIDRAAHVYTEKTTAGAAFVALSLAGERFRGQALIVEGTDAFKQAVARAAATEGVDVRFADPLMEEARKDALRLKTKPQELASPVVIKWMDVRNSRTSKLSDIDYTRIWIAADAGTATYAGRRKMADGCEVLLLTKGGQTLVKPASAAVVAKASRWKIGDSVRLDDRGRFVQTPRGRSR